MSVRTYPFKYKPTAHDEQMMDAALSSQLFLVHEIGPTQFLIKGEDSSAKFKVTIGDPQRCSGCTSTRATASAAKSPELCVHIMFVMLKVLRLPRTNSLVWQASLLDTEITNVLSQRYQRMEERAARRRMQQATSNATAASAAVAATSNSAAAAAPPGGSASSAKGRVPPRELDAEDVCPICQDDLIDPAKVTEPLGPDAPPLLPLVHCEWSCGQQLHAKCMRVWAEHQLASMGSSDKKLACPMCRQPWTGTDPDHQRSNEQLVRDLRGREHAPVVTAANKAAAAAVAEPDDATTALVVRAPGVRTSSAPGGGASRTSAASRAVLKCCSCRKPLPLAEGRFMRCVHCTDNYNLCRVCFIRSKGIGGGAVPTALLTNRSNHVHCFVEAKPCERPAVASVAASAEDKAAAAAAAEFPYAYGLDWQPAPVKAPPASSHLALILQTRELTHADYELLLGLDENIRANGRPMLHAYLLRTLAVPAMRTGSDCVLCSRTILASQPLRVLSCFHQAHESCLQGAIMYDPLLTCPTDQQAVFPGLAFCTAQAAPRKKKVTPEEAAMADATRTGALQVNANSMMFGLSGTGMRAGGGGSGAANSALVAHTSSSEPNGGGDVDDAASSAPSAPSGGRHSHHFQVTPSAMTAGTAQSIREQRAATSATPGRLRTGTAAFAPPTTSQRDPLQQRLFGAPLQPSGTSSEVPTSSPPVAGISSLSIGSATGTGAPRSSVKPARSRSSGLSSMFAPSYSPDASPTRSPVSTGESVEFNVAATAIGGHTNGTVSAAANTSTPSRHASSRPRVGRPSLSAGVSLSEPAPPLSELLVGMGSSAGATPVRSASANVARPSAAFAKSTRTKPPRSATDAVPFGAGEDLSLGSATGTLLTQGALTASSSRSDRQRRVSGRPSAAFAPSHTADIRSSLTVAPNAETRAEPAPVTNASNHAPGPRRRATSASHTRPTPLGALLAPRSSMSAVSTPPVTTPISSFGLSGSTFSALDRGENAQAGGGGAVGGQVRGAGGRIMRGRTALGETRVR